MTVGRGLRTVILVSGNGTNLQAIIDAVEAGSLTVELIGVISDRPDAFGLERARRAGILAIPIDYANCSSREQYNQWLERELTSLEPELVVLAGYMRIIPDPLVNAYCGRMLNVHPSLLPKYKALETYRRVLEAGDDCHGSTVHFVTSELDAGPAIIQYRVRVRNDETEDNLSARVQAGEYIIYPRAIEWFADGKLELRDDKVWLDDTELNQPVLVNESE
jgi:phosphoribosylglycinamide formyltransferase-1